MSESSETTSGSAPTTPGNTSTEDDRSVDGSGRLPTPGETVNYLLWGTLALLVVFAIVAAVSLYTNVNRIIDLWVTREYRPIVSAAFNLLVLLLAGAGISVLLGQLARRRIGE